MDYIKTTYSKLEVAQTVPIFNSAYSSDSYYAESFDLSLLPNSVGVEKMETSEFSIFSNVMFNEENIKLEKMEDLNTSHPLPHSTKYHDSLNFNIHQQENCFQIYPSPVPSPANNSLQTTWMPYIKQEYNHILPPSPPESNCGALSPRNGFPEKIKSEPDSDVEALIDINYLIEKDNTKKICSKDTNDTFSLSNQLLKEYLEDTSFQKKNNIKLTDLDTSVSGNEQDDIEPVISLALEYAKIDAEKMCQQLQISLNPREWSTDQVQAWIKCTVLEFNMSPIKNLDAMFHENGLALSLLTEEDFIKKSPESGETLYAQLEIWKILCNEMIYPINVASASLKSSQNCIDMSEDEVDQSTVLSNAPPVVQNETKTVTPNKTNGGSHIHLWQFLKELLSTPQLNNTAIRWIDRNKGVFKIEDSVKVAKLWGRRKNRPAMNYDKLSRSIRQYYKKGIMKKTERSQRLVYQFCHPYNI